MNHSSSITSNSSEKIVLKGSNEEGIGGTGVSTKNKVFPIPAIETTDINAIEMEAKNIERKRQRLVELRHASMCPCGPNECTVSPYCWQLKILWKHILQCKNDDCNIRLCLSSRYILTHYRNCRDGTCEICAPVRNPLQRSLQMAINIHKRASTEASDESSSSDETVSSYSSTEELPSTERSQSKKIRRRTVSEENATLSSSPVVSISLPNSVSSSLSRQSTFLDSYVPGSGVLQSQGSTQGITTPATTITTTDSTTVSSTTTSTLTRSLSMNKLLNDFDFLIEKLQHCQLITENEELLQRETDLEKEKERERENEKSAKRAIMKEGQFKMKRSNKNIEEGDETIREEIEPQTHPLIFNGLFVLQHVQICMQNQNQNQSQSQVPTTATGDSTTSSTDKTTDQVPLLTHQSSSSSKKCNWILCQVMKRLLCHYEICSLRAIQQQQQYCQFIKRENSMGENTTTAKPELSSIGEEKEMKFKVQDVISNVVRLETSGKSPKHKESSSIERQGSLKSKENVCSICPKVHTLLLQFANQLNQQNASIRPLSNLSSTATAAAASSTLPSSSTSVTTATTN